MPEAKVKIIDGESFSVSQPYSAGHVLTDIEARVLNQVRSENIGNNMRSAVKDAKEKKDKGDSTDFDKLAAIVAAYDAEYTFATPGSGPSRKLDPLEREAISLAKEVVAKKLADKGLSARVVPEGETKESWAEKIAANVEKFAGHEAILKLAKQRLAQKDKSLADLELS